MSQRGLVWYGGEFPITVNTKVKRKVRMVFEGCEIRGLITKQQGNLFNTKVIIPSVVVIRRNIGRSGNVEMVVSVDHG